MPSMKLEPEFQEKVLRLVQQIPFGRVATYGSLALMSGYPRRARHVGHILRGISETTAQDIPWHRVINSSGKLSTYKVGTGNLQRVLLEAEGIVFSSGGKLNLQTLEWWIDP
jgi:methylated-DNA-protein-cysteine methyltransferase related protein